MKKSFYVLLSAIFFTQPFTAQALDSTGQGARILTPIGSTYILAMGTSYASGWSYYGMGELFYTLRLYTPGPCRGATRPYVQVHIQQIQSNPGESLKFVALTPEYGDPGQLGQPSLRWIGYAYEIPIWVKEVSTGGTTNLANIQFSWTLYCYTDNTISSTYLYR